MAKKGEKEDQVAEVASLERLGEFYNGFPNNRGKKKRLWNGLLEKLKNSCIFDCYDLRPPQIYLVGRVSGRNRTLKDLESAGPYPQEQEFSKERYVKRRGR